MHDPESVSLVLVIIAFITIAVGPIMNAFAMLLVLVKIAFVTIPIGPYVHSLPVFHIFNEITYVHVPFGPIVLPLSSPEVIHKIALIFITLPFAFTPNSDAVSIRNSVFELALITIACLGPVQAAVPTLSAV
jgi:hypothetical protein